MADELNELNHEHTGSVAVLGVNFDAPEPEEALRQAQRMKIDFPVYAEDPAAALGVTRPEVLPTTFVFAPDGSLAQTMVGPQTLDQFKAAVGLPAG